MDAVYVHIPFCRHICSYCDFCKVLHIDTFVESYLDALQQEILNTYDGELINTIYIGGGTPSCLTKNERIKLFRIMENFKRTPNCEYTFECNPSDINEDLLDDLVMGGVNRVSIGIESFDESNLKLLERQINYDDIKNKIELLHRRGIDNINLDLMYALPGEKLSTVKKDIKTLISLKPTHISTYSLIIENHTILNNNKTEYINEDLDRKMYDTINNILSKNGYKRYEVSNFSLPGYESRHNKNYWLNEEYYGFGLGAAGFKAGVRYSNTKNLAKYLSLKFREEEVLLSYKEQTDNELMLGLRLVEGIDVDRFYDKYGRDIQDLYPVEELIKSHDLIYSNGHLFINPDELYVMNSILVKLL